MNIGIYGIYRLMKWHIYATIWHYMHVMICRFIMKTLLVIIISEYCFFVSEYDIKYCYQDMTFLREDICLYSQDMTLERHYIYTVIISSILPINITI